MTKSEDENPVSRPPFLLHSFLVVAGAYVANIAALFLIVYAVYPEPIALLGAEPAEFKQVMENQPERIFPAGMFWLLLGSSVVTCSVLGYLVARLAPLAKFPHAIFFATILFVQYLQLSLGADADSRTKFILLMVVSSVAALIGANRYLQLAAVGSEPDSGDDSA